MPIVFLRDKYKKFLLIESADNEQSNLVRVK